MCVCEADGYEIVENWRPKWGDLHPFLLPVATKGSELTLEVLALMIRDPKGKQLRPDEWQVVSQQPRKTKVVKLLANDVGRHCSTCQLH